MKYEVLRAGVSSDRIVNRVELMKAYDGGSTPYHKAVFYLRPLTEDIPEVVPAVELFLSVPGGDEYIDSIEPVRCESGEYIVEMRYEQMIAERGVGYAELRFGGEKLAGFVFATTGAYIPGYWEGEDLKPLEEFTDEAAEAKFKDCFGFKYEAFFKTPEWAREWDEFDFMRDIYPHIRRKE